MAVKRKDDITWVQYDKHLSYEIREEDGERLLWLMLRDYADPDVVAIASFKIPAALAGALKRGLR